MGHFYTLYLEHLQLRCIQAEKKSVKSNQCCSSVFKGKKVQPQSTYLDSYLLLVQEITVLTYNKEKTEVLHSFIVM